MEPFNLPSLPVPALFDASIRLLGVAIAVSAIILASRWLTELTSPRPVAKLPSAALAQPETSITTFGRLFGANETRPEVVEGLRLTGVFAGSRGGGFATFLTRDGAVSVFSGDEVVPGVRLKQIERDRVILLTADAKRELLLSGDREPAAGAPIQAGATPAQTAAATVQASAYSLGSRRRNAQRSPEEE
jgi:hypothetical protein